MRDRLRFDLDTIVAKHVKMAASPMRAVALIQGSIVFLVCLAAGFRPAQPLLLPLALLFMALIAIMCTAIGTAVGSVLQDMSINSAVAALRFFFTVTLDRPDLARRLTVVRVTLSRPS